MTIRIGVLAAVCLALLGCQTAKDTGQTSAPASASVSAPAPSSALLQGKVLAIATEFPPDLYAMKAKNVQMATFNPGTDIQMGNAEGKQVVQTYGIADPALAISETLGQKLIGTYGMQRLQGVPPSVVPGTPDVLMRFYPGADYLLVVSTTNWTYYYYSFDWSHYRVLYQSKFRLIEAATKRVVAQSACSSQQEDKPRPDITQLLANNAEVLKAFLARATADCAKKLSAAL